MKHFLSIAANLLVSIGIGLAAINYFFSGWELGFADFLGILPYNLPLIIALTYMAGYLQDGFCLYWIGRVNEDSATQRRGETNIIILGFSYLAIFVFVPSLLNLMGLILGIFAVQVISSLLLAYLKLRFGYYDTDKQKNSGNARVILRRVLLAVSSLVFVWGIFMLQTIQRISAQFQR